MAHPALTRAFLQAAATATIHFQPEQYTHPPPPVPPFLLAQNLSSKWIAPTDNLRPKPDTAKRRHQLLKGIVMHHHRPRSVVHDCNKLYLKWLSEYVCLLHTRNQQHLWPASSTLCTAVSRRLVIPRCLLYIIKECIHPLVF